ncbi:hypothetical protein AAFF_G00085370 [Aldrovandia affinis]|uniref:Uncharacterized protein n=1 Tax=Aldrovandia affinis TaxID=143900 RepID=A0AAD7RWY2_9TELE|nr:hypothetical protein AAFF_G00085370 [Aldrovandia affinis]
MKNFINTMSSHEGAELPWSHSNQPFSFDPNSMASALERLLGNPGQELDSDDLEDDDDDDDDDDENDDDDDDEDEGPVESACRGAGPGGEAGVEALGSLRRYMEEMDQELQGTNIGHSFTQSQGGGGAGPAKGAVPPQGSDSPRPEEEEELVPLDVDLNLITNLLQSLSSQAGLAGPASNLLQSLGLHLPPDADP